MKRNFIVFILFFLLSNAQASTLNVMSYNIRNANISDGLNYWLFRKENVAKLIGHRWHVDIAGLQECEVSQGRDLEGYLSDYNIYWGKPRANGPAQGEYTPIFYAKSKVRLIKGGTFWLSPTPDKPGKAEWGARFPRVVTWAEFQNRQSGELFFFFNTHFDFQGAASHINSAMVLKTEVQKIAGSFPVVISGDFNNTAQGGGIIEMKKMFNDANLVSKTPAQGPTSTMVGDKDWTIVKPGFAKYDFIFVSSDVVVESHRVIDDKSNGHFLSDHLPVFAVVNLGEEVDYGAKSAPNPPYK